MICHAHCSTNSRLAELAAEEARAPMLHAELEAVMMQHVTEKRLATGQARANQGSQGKAPVGAGADSSTGPSGGLAASGGRRRAGTITESAEAGAPGPGPRRRRSNTETSLADATAASAVSATSSATLAAASHAPSAGDAAADSHASLLLRLCATPLAFCESLWSIIDDTIKVAQCEIYTYSPPWGDVDPCAAGAL